MFIGTEIRLDIGIDAAQHKLAALIRGGLFGRASARAYDQWQAGLVRVGLRAMMLGMYKIARVRVSGVVTRGDAAMWAMRWEVAESGGPVVPALDADIKLIPTGPYATVLAVSGVCRPPLARLAAELDPTVAQQVAQAAIQGFTSHIATDITRAVAVPEARNGTMPGPAPETGRRDRSAR
jgi:hypothetical protein